jgi:hypothetical protein
MDDSEVRNRIIEKLLRKRVVGSHKKRVDTVTNWLPSHAQGRGEQLIREMVTEPNTPVEGYGGSRDNIRLTSVADAVEYLEQHDGNVPFGFD